MSWHAFDAVDDAVQVTRGFLFPVTLSRWWRLVVVALFLGGFSSIGNVGTNLSSLAPNATVPTTGGAEIGPAAPAALGIVGLAIAGLIGIFILVSALLREPVRLAYLDALRDDDVRLGRVGSRLWPGLKLLVFQIAVWVLVAVVIVGLLFAVTLIAGISLNSAGPESVPPGVGAGVLIGSFLLVGLLLFVTVVVSHFTVEFVAPTMVATDSGVLAAWRRFWGVLTDQPGQFVLYLIVRLFLNIGVSIALGLVTAILSGLILLASGVVIGGIIALVGGLSAATESLLVLLVLVAAGAIALLGLLFGAILPVRVVGLTFTTGYALSVLGRADPDLAILADYDQEGPGGPSASGGGRGPVEGDDRFGVDDDRPGERAGDQSEGANDESAGDSFGFGDDERR